MGLGINMSVFKNDIEDLEEDVKTLRTVYTFLHVNGIDHNDLTEQETAKFRELLENLHIAYMKFTQHNNITDMQLQIDDCSERWSEESQ